MGSHPQDEADALGLYFCILHFCVLFVYGMCRICLISKTPSAQPCPEMDKDPCYLLCRKACQAQAYGVYSVEYASQLEASTSNMIMKETRP